MIRMTRSDSLWQMCLGIITAVTRAGRTLTPWSTIAMLTVSVCDTAVIHWVFQDQVTHVTNESRGGPHQAGQSRPPGSGNSRGLFSSLIAQSSLVSQFTMLPSVTSLSLMTTLVFMTRVYITLGATLPYSLILPTETKCKEYSKSIAPSIAQNTNGKFQSNAAWKVSMLIWYDFQVR